MTLEDHLRKASRFGEVKGTYGEGIGNIGSGGATHSRHPNSARFHAILKTLGELHDRKQSDYGKGEDPFANVRGSQEWKVKPWVGAMIRLTDKVKRLQTLAEKGVLANESAFDSFDDIAVYAVIARVLYEQEECCAQSTAG